MTAVSPYVNVNWVKSMCSGHIYHNLSCCDDLSKFGKEYLNSLKCEFCTFFSIKFRKFWHDARLSRTNRHIVVKSENSPVFFGPPVWIKTYYILLLFNRAVVPKLLHFITGLQKAKIYCMFGTDFLQVKCSFCHLGNSVKALKGK